MPTIDFLSAKRLRFAGYIIVSIWLGDLIFPYDNFIGFLAACLAMLGFLFLEGAVIERRRGQ